MSESKEQSDAEGNNNAPLPTHNADAKVPPTSGTAATTQKRRRVTGKASGAGGDELHHKVMEKDRANSDVKNVQED